MLGGMKTIFWFKTDCFSRVYLTALIVLLEYLNIDIRKFYRVYRYHDIKIYINTIDISRQHYTTINSLTSTKNMKMLSLASHFTQKKCLHRILDTI